MGRLRHLATFTGSELTALWRERAAGGMEHALAVRLGHHVGIRAVGSRLDGLAGATAELAGRAGSTDGRLAGLEEQRGQAGTGSTASPAGSTICRAVSTGWPPPCPPFTCSRRSSAV